MVEQTMNERELILNAITDRGGERPVGGRTAQDPHLAMLSASKCGKQHIPSRGGFGQHGRPWIRAPRRSAGARGCGVKP